MRTLYPWRPLERLVGWTLAASVLLVVLPIAAVAAGMVVFPIDFVLKLVGVSAANGASEDTVTFRPE